MGAWRTWLEGNWFSFIQTIGIIGGLVVAVVTMERERRSRQLGDYLTMIQRQSFALDIAAGRNGEIHPVLIAQPFVSIWRFGPNFADDSDVEPDFVEEMGLVQVKDFDRFGTGGLGCVSNSSSANTLARGQLQPKVRRRLALSHRSQHGGIEADRDPIIDRARPLGVHRLPLPSECCNERAVQGPPFRSGGRRTLSRCSAGPPCSLFRRRLPKAGLP